MNRNALGRSRLGPTYVVVVASVITWCLTADACRNLPAFDTGRHQYSRFITYTLEPIPGRSGAEPRTRVTMSVPNHESRPFTIRMPIWTPGEYRVQNHGRNVQALTARDDTPATIRQLALGVWEVAPADERDVLLTYELPNTRPGIFTENVDVRTRSAFYDSASVFLYVQDRTDEPVVLRVLPPAGWANALTPLPQEPDGSFRADTYEELVDSPILVGERVERTFMLDNAAHVIAFFGSHRGADYDAYRSAFRQIVEAGKAYMGGLPYKRYVLFVDMHGRGGGLEHANSARVALARDAPPRFSARFLAHEYFHLWNVKRIRPAAMRPMDFGKTPVTRNLWFCEGVTEYVAGLLTLRAGLVSEEQYFSSIAALAVAHASMRGRGRITAEEASLRVWTDGRSSGYGGVSIYTTGEMIGLCLDLELLHQTNGQAGFREVFRDLMLRHGPQQPGYDEDGIRKAVIRTGGAEMGPFYDRLVRTTAEPPLEQCLGYVGLRLDRDGQAVLPDPHAADAARRLREIWLYGR